MYILKRELLSQKIVIMIWSIAIGGMIAIALLVYPQMQEQMDQINEMMSSMGGLTKAFGMDQMDFNNIMNYYALECGNMLSIGGAFFAAIIGVSALMKEERDRTAEFLLTHPISRKKVITEKLISVAVMITIINAVILVLGAVSMLIVGGEFSWSSLLIFHLAYYLMQLEIAGICFGISAFISRFGAGIGIGVAAVFYFMNIISNITADAKFLKYITPFGYADGSHIVSSGSIDVKYLLTGCCFMIAGIVAAYIKYMKKDIR